jgi:hypothetical protein
MISPLAASTRSPAWMVTVSTVALPSARLGMAVRMTGWKA